MKHYLFRITNKSSFLNFKKLISKKGLTQIYTIQETETSTWLVGGFVETDLSESDFRLQDVTLVESSSQLDPDWKNQAEIFSPYFSEGLIQLDLSPYGVENKVKFYPGEGFGDLSHPTTTLMLELASPYIKDRVILDIGSGNGILTITASALEAKKSYGVEIEPLALTHSRNNLALNQLNNVYFYDTISLPSSIVPDLIFCNMISSEQEVAYQFYPQFSIKPLIIVTSGVLSSQREEYLKKCQEKNWSLVSELEKNGWLGFVFQTS